MKRTRLGLRAFQLVLAVALLLLPQAAAAQTPAPEQPIPARIYVDAWEEVNALAARYDVWQVSRDGRSLVAGLRAGEIDALRAAGYRVEPEPGLLPAPPALTGSTAASGGIPGYTCYRTVEETYADLSALAASHPHLAEWVDIGDSWDKTQPSGSPGYDLHALVLTNEAQPGPKFAFALMAAIHAREYVTAEGAARFAERLVANYGTDPDVTWLLDHGALHVIPYANPDGRKFAEAGSYWRKNTNNDLCPGGDYGVDLNRNSSFKWNECEGSFCSSDDACYPTYRGAAPRSEPETQAVEAYLTSLFPDRRGPELTDPAPADTPGLFISLHSYSSLVLFPWGWTDAAAPNAAALQTLGRKFGFYTGYTVCQSGAPFCLYQTDGATDDWAYGDLGVAAYTFELGTEFFQQCSDFEQEIMPGLHDALLYAFKAARRPYQSPSGPEVVGVAAPAQVYAGDPVTVTATVSDARYYSGNDFLWGAEPVQDVAAVSVTVDAPPWAEGAPQLAMSAADGAFDSAQEDATVVLDGAALAPGRHTLFVAAQDAAGNTGVPGAAFVEVLPVLPYDLHAVGEAEQEKPGGPAARIFYTFDVQNTGALSATLAADVAGEWVAWAVLPASPLASLERTSVTLAVQVPPTATVGMSSTATITLWPHDDVTRQVTLHATTTVTAPVLHLPFVAHQE
jgi:hypothetical protein